MKTNFVHQVQLRFDFRNPLWDTLGVQKVLLVILILVIGFGAYFVGKNQTGLNKQATSTQSAPT